jgi:hypothetical protein
MDQGFRAHGQVRTKTLFPGASLLIGLAGPNPSPIINILAQFAGSNG